MSTTKRRNRPSRAKNLNAPEHWLAWLRGCQQQAKGNPHHPFEAKGPLGAITGQDARALHAFAACAQLWAASDDDGRRGALHAMRSLLPAMQVCCWPFARELIAQQREWTDRDPLWMQVRQLELVEKAS